MLPSNEILYSAGKNDECYTYEYGVVPILKYIKKDWVVWCPFDTEESNFVKLISKTNKVIRSHIDEGADFYTYEPEEHWDCIISNPPFTGKRKIVERALSFNKPFALILPNTIFNDKYPVWSFKELEKQPQILTFDKRMEFDRKEGIYASSITFLSSYFCYNFLPRDFIQETLNKPTKGKNI